MPQHRRLAEYPSCVCLNSGPEHPLIPYDQAQPRYHSPFPGSPCWDWEMGVSIRTVLLLRVSITSLAQAYSACTMAAGSLSSGSQNYSRFLSRKVFNGGNVMLTKLLKGCKLCPHSCGPEGVKAVSAIHVGMLMLLPASRRGSLQGV